MSRRAIPSSRPWTSWTMLPPAGDPARVPPGAGRGHLHQQLPVAAHPHRLRGFGKPEPETPPASPLAPRRCPPHGPWRHPPQGPRRHRGAGRQGDLLHARVARFRKLESFPFKRNRRAAPQAARQPERPGFRGVRPAGPVHQAVGAFVERRAQETVAVLRDPPATRPRRPASRTQSPRRQADAERTRKVPDHVPPRQTPADQVGAGFHQHPPAPRPLALHLHPADEVEARASRSDCVPVPKTIRSGQARRARKTSNTASGERAGRDKY